MKKNRTYVGSKGSPTIKSFLFNYVIKSNRYFSLFYGKGSFENLDEFRFIKWVCSERDKSLLNYASDTAVIEYFLYQDLIDENVFTRGDFIFADPPYMFSSRLSGRLYYKHEFSIEDHVLFLNNVRNITARVMICHPKNDLYDKMLNGWYNYEFTYQTRGGVFKDSVYLNYNHRNLPLLVYKYLGVDFTDRQRVKRKRKNLLRKIMSLSFHEWQAVKEQL